MANVEANVEAKRDLEQALLERLELWGYETAAEPGPAAALACAAARAYVKRFCGLSEAEIEAEIKGEIKGEIAGELRDVLLNLAGVYYLRGHMNDEAGSAAAGVGTERSISSLRLGDLAVGFADSGGGSELKQRQEFCDKIFRECREALTSWRRLVFL